MSSSSRRNLKYLTCGVVLFSLLGVVLIVLGVTLMDPFTFNATSTGTLLWILDGTIPKQPPAFSFGNTTPHLLAVVNRIYSAAEDPDVKRLVIRVQNFSGGLADLEEIRTALEQFRSNGKSIDVYADGFTTGTYFLASVADQIYLSPQSNIWFHGIGAELLFYREFLDMIGVEPQMLSVGKFKSGPEPYMRTEMSPETREELSALVNAIHEFIAEKVAVSRDIPADTLESLMRTSLFYAEEAVEQKLVDDVRYFPEELRDSTTDLMKYDTDDSPGLFAPKIAVLFATGDIIYGAGGRGELFSRQQIGSQSLCRVIRELTDDDDIEAVVLRVDSPGGSPLASDLIWQDLSRLKVSKPLVVSMGSVAASGGYYIAVPGDVVLADNTTITGSIGVYGGKFAISGLLDRLRIHRDSVQSNENTNMMSLYTPWNDQQKEIILRQMEETYRLFKQRVSDGRDLTDDEVEFLAQGRVWIGEDAVEKGLVDELGGLRQAVQTAKSLLGYRPDKAISVEIYPKTSGFMELAQTMIPQVSTAFPAEWTDQLNRLMQFQNEPVLLWFPVELTGS